MLVLNISLTGQQPHMHLLCVCVRAYILWSMTVEVYHAVQLLFTTITIRCVCTSVAEVLV